MAERWTWLVFISFCLFVQAKAGDRTIPRRDTPKVAPKISRTVSFEKSDVEEGSVAVATCSVVVGDLPITFSWLKDRAPISPNQGITQREVNQFSSQLTIQKTHSLHAGLYTCVAKNSAGEDKQTISLRIVGKSSGPAIGRETSGTGSNSGPKTTSRSLSTTEIDEQRLQLEKELWEMEKKVLQLKSQKLQLEVDCMKKNTGFCIGAKFP